MFTEETRNLLNQAVELSGVGALVSAITMGLLAWIALKAAWIGANTWFTLTRPAAAARIAHYYETRPKLCTLLGLLNLLLGGLLALVLIAARVLALVGFGVFLALLAMLVLAYLPAYMRLGAKLEDTEEDPLGDEPGWLPAWPAVLRGGLLCEAALLTPFLGQIASAAMALRGVGAVALAVIHRNREIPQPPAPVMPPPDPS